MISTFSTGTFYLTTFSFTTGEALATFLIFESLTTDLFYLLATYFLTAFLALLFFTCFLIYDAVYFSGVTIFFVTILGDCFALVIFLAFLTSLTFSTEVALVFLIALADTLAFLFYALAIVIFLNNFGKI